VENHSQFLLRPHHRGASSLFGVGTAPPPPPPPLPRQSHPAHTPLERRVFFYSILYLLHLFSTSFHFYSIYSHTPDRRIRIYHIAFGIPATGPCIAERRLILTGLGKWSVGWCCRLVRVAAFVCPPWMLISMHSLSIRVSGGPFFEANWDRFGCSWILIVSTVALFVDGVFVSGVHKDVLGIEYGILVCGTHIYGGMLKKTCKHCLSSHACEYCSN